MPAWEWSRYHKYEDSQTLMNNRQNNRRRGRGGGSGGPRPNGANGSRIDNRARGNASQLHEKYKTLARDMQTQGDRVMTEYYLQFADHYYRIINENRPRGDEQAQRRPRDDAEDFGDEPEAVQAAADEGEEVAAESEERAPRPRRGRPSAVPVDEAQDRLDIDRLPPAFAAGDEDEAEADVDAGEAAKPRRRGRPRKSEVAAAE